MQRTATTTTTTSLARAVTLVLLTASSGCSTTRGASQGTEAQPHDPTDARMRQLEEQNAKSARQLDARMRQLEEQNAKSAQQLREERTALGDRLAAVERKVSELLALRAAPSQAPPAGAGGNRRVPETGVARSKNADGRRVATRVPDGSGGTAAPQPGQAPQASPPGSADRRDLLVVAMEQERSGNKAAALEVYEHFVKSWPTDPLTPQALFRMGELSFADRRYKDAISAYSTIARDFPQSEQAPEALLRTGESMSALELKTEARGIWQEVQRRYPGTSAARRSQQLLAESSGPTPAGSKKR